MQYADLESIIFSTYGTQLTGTLRSFVIDLREQLLHNNHQLRPTLDTIQHFEGVARDRFAALVGGYVRDKAALTPDNVLQYPLNAPAWAIAQKVLAAQAPGFISQVPLWERTKTDG